MKRMSPRVRAELERARRPAVMFMIGMALAGPAGAFLIREDAATRQAAQAAAATQTAVMDESAAREALTASLAKMFNVPLDLATEITTAAEREGITPRIAFGLVKTESRFKTTAVSPVGALGLTQVMPGTAKWLEPGITKKELLEPQTNLRLGFSYLRKLMNQYDGDVRLALTAYNRGPGAVRKSMRNGQNPENGYADLVLRDETLPKTPLMVAHTTTGGYTKLINAKMKANGKATTSTKAKAKPKATVKPKTTKLARAKAPAKKSPVKKAAPKKATVKKASLPAPPKIDIPEPKVS